MSTRPPPDEVREMWVEPLCTSLSSAYGEFDRWLASVKAEAWAEGYSSGQDSVYTSSDEWPAATANPYREEPK